MPRPMTHLVQGSNERLTNRQRQTTCVRGNTCVAHTLPSTATLISVAPSLLASSISHIEIHIPSLLVRRESKSEGEEHAKPAIPSLTPPRLDLLLPLSVPSLRWIHSIAYRVHAMRTDAKTSYYASFYCVQHK